MIAKVKADVHAAHAKWETERDRAGNVTGYVGRFPKEHREHAFGAARFFLRKKITRMPPEELVQTDDDALVIHLERDRGSQQGDNLPRFENWVRDYHPELLPPDRARELKARDEAIELKAVETALAFEPVAGRVAHELIEEMQWESAAGPEQNNIVAVTHDPMAAFQAALYLRNKKFMPEKAFWRINAEAHHALATAEDMEFRLAVSSRQFIRFAKEFPKAGELKTPEEPAWAMHIADHSERPGIKPEKAALRDHKRDIAGKPLFR